MAWPEKEKKPYFIITPLTTWRLEAIKIYSGNAIGSQQHVSRQRRQKSISSGKPILRFLSKTTKTVDQSAG